MNPIARILQPRGLLVAMHLPYVAFMAARSITGLSFDAEVNRWSALPLVLTAGAIQVRHSLAAADGVRPAHWEWTLFLLFLITYLPAPLFLFRWPSLHWFLIASLLMLLPRRAAIAAAVTDAVALAVWLAVTATAPIGGSELAWGVVTDMIIFVAGSASLYGAARLVWLAKELRATRTQLADFAIERERLRISRDLHDLLGHSLSAVALKGDLAQRLLERQEMSRAEAEIQSLVSVARSASRDLREITHRQPTVSLASELDRCTDILAAVGVETRIT